MNRIRAEAIRVMYAQMRVTAFATVVVTTYMVGVSLAFTSWPVVLGWAVWPPLLLAMRELSVRAFLAAAPGDAAMPRWARLAVVQQALIGIAWAATMFLFAHPDQPLSVALTLCCLYSIGAGSVTSLSYHPPANVALITILFGAILARMLAAGTTAYLLVGGASALFGVTMIAYCRNQSVAVLEALRIRFENVELVAALQQQTARAEAANLAKSRFLAAASHDLRQPLYALSLFSAVLDELELDAAGRRIVAQIGDSISVMEQLFDGLLDISRLEAGVVLPRLEAVAVDALFDRLSQVFWPQAMQKGLELRLRSNGEWVTSDIGLLERALANLIANALSATTAGGVLMAARRRGPDLRFEVYDTGRGIAEADRARIFDEFVQLENPERDRRKGLGLGLGIARRSLDLIGAGLTLRSRPGRGSCFAFTQPLCAAPSIGDAVVHRPVPAPFLPSEGAVLVVDDDLDVRTALGELLHRRGIRADLHAAPASALDRLREGDRYRLVLADYRMPGDMDGLMFLAAVRRLHPQPLPPCALVTGDFDPALLARAADEGVTVLHKPLSRDTLRDWLSSANGRSA